MPAPLQLQLSEEQDQQLIELRRSEGVPQRTKDRAEAVRLNAHGWKVDQIAHYLHWAPQTVRVALHRWQNRGLAGLFDAPRPGRNRKWQEVDMVCLDSWIEEERTYSCRQLADKLKQRGRRISMLGLWHPQVGFE